MAVTREEVEHIGLLSRLALSDEEIETFSRQLSQILGYAAQLNELDTSNIEPMFYSIPIENVFREDSRGEPLPLGNALKNAAKTNGPFFEVPKVADGS